MLFDPGTLLLMGLCVVCQHTEGIIHVQSVGCVYRYDGYFNLQCNRPNTIQIVNATVGISSRQCRNESICCKSPTDDTVEESDIDMQELRSRCDGRRKCEVSILKKNTGGESTDYESVNYICRKSVYSLGCLYKDTGSFKLQCQEHQHIYISYSTLGRSSTSCRYKRICCQSRPRRACAEAASSRQLQQLKDSCDGRQQCQVTVIKGRCKKRPRGPTDYQAVNYFCINNLPGADLTRTASTTTTAAWTTAAWSTAALTTTAQVSNTSDLADSSRSKLTNRETDTTCRQTNIALLVGLMTATCVVVIASVLVILIYRRRRRHPASHPALENQPTQPEYAITDFNQSASPETNHYDTVLTDTDLTDISTHPPDDTHVFYNYIRQIVAPPDDTHVYYNEQSVARGAKNEPQNSQETSPDVSLDELYNQPNKQRKPATVSQHYEYVYGHGAAGGKRGDEEAGGKRGADEAGGNGGAEDGESEVGNQDLDYVDIDHSATRSKVNRSHPRSEEVIYAELQRKDTDTNHQVDSGETPGDSDMAMIENELYN